MVPAKVMTSSIFGRSRMLRSPTFSRHALDSNMATFVIDAINNEFQTTAVLI